VTSGKGNSAGIVKREKGLEIVEVKKGAGSVN